jgi:hypothetical protein
MIKVGRDFDESAFARVVALLERAGCWDCLGTPFFSNDQFNGRLPD